MSGETFTLGELAQLVTSGSLRAMARMLNDAGANPALDKNEPDRSAVVARQTVSDLAAARAGDRVGRVLGRLLSETMGVDHGS